MIEILQAIVDFITYTPTLYVDGIAGDIQGAAGWIAALPYIASAITSVVGGAMSASASSMSASKMKKAAQKNYNMLMENAEMSKMTLNEQMDLYKEDMDSYRSSMIQRYGLAGGIRADDAGLKEVSDYKFDTDTTPLDVETLKKDYDEKWRKENSDKEAWVKAKVEQAEKDYNSHLSNKEIEENEFYTGYMRNSDYRKYSKEYDKLYGAPSKQLSDKDWTDKLGEALKTYQGKQTNWQTKADTSAILNLQTSTSNMQRDINNAYKAGMIDYWRQRENAQLTKDTYQFQAAQYSTQAQTTLASSFLSAFKYGANAYTAYKT